MAHADLTQPDEFAAFYRRHVEGLLEYLARRTHDRERTAELCVETFAAALDDAHRQDPAKAPAEDWLYGIARRLLDDASRRDVVQRRARRRLGLPELDPGDGFVEALEEELVEAARFRASRRRDRRPLPGGLAAGAAAAAIALLGTLAISHGDAPEPAQRASAAVPLAPMFPAAACAGLDARGESAAERAPGGGAGDLIGALPITTLDATGTRQAAGTTLHAVTSLGVSDDAGCAPDDGPGACVAVEGDAGYRCFRRADVRAGRALARTARGLVVGVVADDVGRVTLTARGRTTSLGVVDNIYEAPLGVPAGTRIEVALAQQSTGVCRREVAPELLARVPVLRRESDEPLAVPRPLRQALDRGAEYRFDGVLLRSARLWGRTRSVEFWAVPVVARGSGWCAPANDVCVVAVPPAAPTDAECSRRGRPRFWRFAPLLPDNAAIYGVVGERVTGVRVGAGRLAARVHARANMIGGVLPFRYDDGVRVELIRARGR